VKVPNVLPITTTKYRYSENREDDDTNKIYTKRILYSAKNKLQKGKEIKMVHATVIQRIR